MVRDVVLVRKWVLLEEREGEVKKVVGGSPVSVQTIVPEMGIGEEERGLTWSGEAEGEGVD
jgi:hypothetical protein